MERPRPSITDFLTDGSLAALCGALSEMSGAHITLHDDRGRRVALTAPEEVASGSPPWRIEEADARSEGLAQALARLAEGSEAGGDEAPEDDAEGRVTLAPLRVLGMTVGVLVIEEPPGSASTGARQLREIVRLLASAVHELFEADIELARRNAELDMLFRLSSLLVAARDVESVLDAALRSAIDILAFDAGAVLLLEEESGALTLRASMGMDGVEDAAAGQEEDVPRGFVSVASCDLSFSERRIGVMRLYSRTATALSREEHALLRTINEQVAAAVTSARLVESERRGRQVQRQLRLAAEVQRRLLPAQAPVVAGLDMAARYIPSLELAGDFYDLIDLDGHLGIAVGDVAGKGAPAAILMASVRSTLRAHATEVYHLDEILSRVNRAMTRDTLPNEFATLFYGVIDPRTLRLTYCSAGHDPTYLLRLPADRAPDARDLHALDIGGTVIGIDASQKYERGMFDLAPGDTLVAYTDGIVDARNFDEQRFGRERLRQVIIDSVSADRGITAQKLADHLVWEVRRFIGLNPAIDDMTVLVVRVRER